MNQHLLNTAPVSFWLLISLLFVLAGNAAHAETPDKEPVLHIADVQTLDYPGKCDGTMEDKLVYEVFVADEHLEGKIKFFAKGPRGTNQKFEIADLLHEEVKLKSLALSGRLGNGWRNRGLWVQHVDSGEKQQLNYMPGQFRCNTKGIITVRYNNIWVRVKPLSSSTIAE